MIEDWVIFGQGSPRVYWSRAADMPVLQVRRLRLVVAALIFLCMLLYSLFAFDGPTKWRAENGWTQNTIVPNLKPPEPQKPLQGPVHEPPRFMTSQAGPVKTSEVAASHTLSASETFEAEVSASPTSSASEISEVSASSTSSPSESPTPVDCISFEQLQAQKPGPKSAGRRQFPYVRPPPECRTFNLPSLEKLVTNMKTTIKDPDLFRLFENSYPNTLDTTIKWRGFHNNTDEELAFVITGDINAMWLRDSASQIYSYLPLLEASSDPDSLASLWRGLINSHARYIIISPYCHSFQPPPESNIPPTHNGAYSQNRPMPPYDPSLVFDCKWELDSLASFLQISTAYYERTKDIEFFQKYQWVSAVKAAVDAAGAMRLGTYAPDGKVEKSAWTFTGWTNRGSETLTNDGIGNPTKSNGMVRSAFRPSDDACIFQLLVPANMMWAKYLEEASFIMEKMSGEEAKNLTQEMRDFALGIRTGVDKDAVVHHQKYGDIWAYEIDGYGSANVMDDANVPSLLSIPLFNYSQSSFPLPSTSPKRDYDALYKNTRKFVLSDDNPYFMHGPAISAVGGPHLGPGKAWPMAATVRALTALLQVPSASETEQVEIVSEVKEQIRMVLDSTAGTGVVHESVSSWAEHDWTRAWFGWANGLFGELIMRVAEEDSRNTDGEMLAVSWQVQTPDT